ncbi:hypothetical protein DGG96_07405 [Legionella qingyii]|uniref:Uncharacterized protein n=1 Tax=Legionella qingyii TaxID=2184757 RepID=A0A317U2N5_9GAMM|nr:hypothetical protein DGG96_07405 [Legionella qingyii]
MDLLLGAVIEGVQQTGLLFKQNQVLFNALDLMRIGDSHSVFEQHLSSLSVGHLVLILVYYEATKDLLQVHELMVVVFLAPCVHPSHQRARRIMRMLAVLFIKPSTDLSI